MDEREEREQQIIISNVNRLGQLPVDECFPLQQPQLTYRHSEIEIKLLVKVKLSE